MKSNTLTKLFSLRLLSIKITLIIIVILMSINSLIYIGLARFLVDESIVNQIKDLKDEMYLIQESLNFTTDENASPQQQNVIKYFSSRPFVDSVYAINREHIVIASSVVKHNQLPVNKILTESVMNKIDDIQSDIHLMNKSYTWKTDGNTFLLALSPLTPKGYVFIKLDLSNILQAKEEHIYTVLAPYFVMCFLGALLIVIYIYHFVVQRIKQIKNSMETFLLTGKYLAYVDEHNDEISRLGLVLNAMSVQFMQHKKHLNQYKYIVSSSTDMLALLTTDYKYKMVNEKYAAFFEHEQQYFIGKYVQETFSEKYFNKKLKPYAEQCINENRAVIFGCWLTSGHENVFIDVTYSPYCDPESNEVIGIVVNARDSTARVNDLRKIKQQQMELSSTINSMPDGVITIDEVGVILSVNPSTELIFGFSTEQLLGQKVDMLIPNSFTEKHDDYIPHFLTTAESKIIGSAREVRGHRKNKEQFPMRMSIAELPIEDNGQRRFIVIFADLQELKNQETKLNQIQKMHSIGKLSGGIAHDYNNMLGVIMGYCELLEHKLHDQPELKKYADQIKLAGNRGVELTKKILSYAKQQNGQRTEININELILGAEDMIASSLTASIRLRFYLSKNIWQVNIDRYAFEDVLLNLSINAMHAMPYGGELTISTGNISLSQNEALLLDTSQGDYVFLKIKDNGSGISKAVQNKIFEPFFTTKKENGTGLGLSQVLGFMTELHGAVKVNSTENQGSEFILYFPSLSNTGDIDNNSKNQRAVQGSHTISENTLLPVKEVAPPTARVFNILIVDDEESLVECVYEVLSNHFTVYKAKDAQQALSILNTQHIDLLFTDIIMPNMNGYELAEIVENRFPDIIIMFASGYQADLGRFKSTKVTPPIKMDKPYNLEEVLCTINVLLNNS